MELLVLWERGLSEKGISWVLLSGIQKVFIELWMINTDFKYKIPLSVLIMNSGEMSFFPEKKFTSFNN